MWSPVRIAQRCMWENPCKRTLEVRLSEHRQAVQKINNCINWEDTTVHKRAEGFWQRRNVEAIQIRKAMQAQHEPRQRPPATPHGLNTWINLTNHPTLRTTLSNSRDISSCPEIPPLALAWSCSMKLSPTRSAFKVKGATNQTLTSFIIF